MSERFYKYTKDELLELQNAKIGDSVYGNILQKILQDLPSEDLCDVWKSAILSEMEKHYMSVASAEIEREKL